MTVIPFKAPGHAPGQALSFGELVDLYLASLDLAATTRRAYRRTFAAAGDEWGSDRTAATIGVDDVDRVLGRWADAKATTANRHRAALSSLFAFAVKRGEVTTNPVEATERRRQLAGRDQRRAIARDDLEAVLSDRALRLREKTLWRILYETAARASEVLSLDVEDLDLVRRCADTVGKGGNVETLQWSTGTARLLPRYLDGRTSGPVFITERRARLEVAVSDRTDDGHARLSYRAAAHEISRRTGWTLHQLRHSALTHLAEDGVDVPLLKAKSRHRSLRSLEIYVRPGDEAIRAVTDSLDPTRRTRRR